MGKGKTGAIRQTTLDRATLNAMERHGKRLDSMGPARRVRDVPPLVYGSLDIAEARDKWMEGVQQQGETQAVHMLVQFPTTLPGAETEQGQKAMLRHAVAFANGYHGGDAVFAARLDRDEEGRHTVDVFLMPRYDFRYKDGRTQKRASVSKFSKEQARARSGKDDPRAQGRPFKMLGSSISNRRACVGWNHPNARRPGLRTGWSRRLTAWPRTGRAWTPKRRPWRPACWRLRNAKKPS